MLRLGKLVQLVHTGQGRTGLTSTGNNAGRCQLYKQIRQRTYGRWPGALGSPSTSSQHGLQVLPCQHATDGHVQARNSHVDMRCR